MVNNNLGHIDRLIISNFKSYANTQIIGPFKSTFNSIIGPNGAGKSNLMDAISFVLGVRSTVLRGNQLKDLINRQNENDSIENKTAYVELIFLTAEQKELRFKRSIQSTGGSDYSFNGRNVTQVNYNKALEDISILVSVRNFLVFQGDVESLSRKSPKELTNMFEEMSGSSKYKQEFDEKKDLKDKAEEAFVRMFEKRRTMTKEKRQLKEQKMEAEKYQALLELLKDTKLENMLFRLFHTQRELEVERKNYDDEKSALNVTKKEVEFVEKKVEGLNQAKGAAHKEKVLLEKKFTAKYHDVEKRANLLSKTTEQVNHANSQIAENNEKLESIGDQLEKQKKEAAVLENEIKSVENSLHLLSVESDKADRETGELHLQAAQIQQYNSLKAKAGAATAYLQAELDRLKSDLKSSQEHVELLESTIETLRLRVTQGEKNVETYENRKNEMKKILDENQDKLERTKHKLNEDSNAISAASARKDEIDSRLEFINSQLAESKADKRDNERDQKLNEAVEAMKRLFKGVRGRLIDLCKPLQRKYNTAVQVSLGRNMEAVVVDNEKTCAECISYLKEHHVGVATFIPIDSVKYTPIKESLRELGGSSKLVVDCIDYNQDESVLRALLYAVGNTLIVDKLDEGRKLCFSDPSKRFKVVTLDGTQIAKNGNMTGGGSASEFGGSSTWDEREYQKYKDERIKLVKEKAEVDVSHRSSDILTQHKINIQKYENIIKNTKVDFDLSNERLAKEQKDLKALLADFQKKEKELESTNSEIETKTASLSKLEKQIHSEHEKIFGDFSRQVGVKNIEEYESLRLANIQKRKAAQVKLSDQLSKLKNQLDYCKSRNFTAASNTLKSKISSLNENVDKLQKELAKMKKQDSKDQEEIAALNSLVEKLKKTEEDVENELKTTKKTSQSVFSAISSKEKDLIAREASMEKLSTTWRELLRRCELEQIEVPKLSSLKKRSAPSTTASNKKSKKSKHSKPTAEDNEDLEDMDIDEDLAKFDEINIDYSSLKRNKDCDSVEEFNRIKQGYEVEIAKINEQLEVINPNMKANDKFKEAENKMNEQQTSFEEAKEESQRSNDELERVKSERYALFQKAFEHVCTNISSIYKMLTTGNENSAGGNAFLTAENESEPYLHGIKYQVIPPSKRFRDMELLSGGEKSVASLALLFAMHSYKPTPFFVLDEVDAALDPNNVHRVSNYIKQVSHRDNLQCIVISLKDVFYEKADALIGVYRDKESNTSGTLTLDLTQYTD